MVTAIPRSRVAGLVVVTLFGFLTTLVARPVEAADTNPVDTVVQLGDSYSAGYGVLASSLAASTGSCRDVGRSDTGVTPGGRLAEATGADLVFAACGGASVADVEAQFRSVLDEIPGNGTGSTIVFTAGGNDLRSVRGESWTSLLTRCILWDSSCERARNNQPANIERVAADLGDLIEEIIRQRPAASVRVLGYPELMQRTPGCWGMTGIDRNEADFLDAIAREFNDALAAVVDAVGAENVRFVDVEDAFDDHGACQLSWSGKRYVNDVDFVPWSFTVAANSLHPTERGYAAYYRSLAESLSPVRR